MKIKTAAWLGAALLFAGLLAGFIPVSSQGVNCGSVFAASDDPSVADLGSTLSGSIGPVTSTQGSCDSLRSVIRIPAVILLGVGAISVIAALGMYASATAPAARARARRPDTAR